MLVGSDGLGWIHFDDFHLAESIGVIALALILFEGGLTAGWTRDPAGAAAGGQPRARRHADHRRRDRPRGLVAVRVLHGRGPPARLDRGLDRRRRGVLAAARLRAAAAARADARGRGGPQRPDRRAARARVHRVDQAPGLRGRRHAPAVRPAARDRAGRRRRRRLPRARGVRARAALEPRPVPRRLAGRRVARLRPGRRAARLGLPRGLPVRAGARVGEPARPAHRDRVPRGPRVGRAARDVPHARPARVPLRARRDRGEGHAARARDRVRLAAARDARVHARQRLRPAREGRCSAGPACAARCPSSWRPSR